MTPPTTTKTLATKKTRPHTINGSAEVWGPLIRQPEPAARLARILNRSANGLLDACTLTDSDQMWDEARAIAGRILASEPDRKTKPAGCP
jgi:hypothetical protein